MIRRKFASTDPAQQEALNQGFVIFYNEEDSSSIMVLGRQDMGTESWAIIVSFPWVATQKILDSLLQKALSWSEANGFVGLLMNVRDAASGDIDVLKRAGLALEVKHAVVAVSSLPAVVEEEEEEPFSRVIRSTKAKPARKVSHAKTHPTSQLAEPAIAEEGDGRDWEESDDRPPRTHSAPLVSGLQRQQVGPPPTRR